MDQIIHLNERVPFDVKSVLARLTPVQNVWIDRWAFIDFNDGRIESKSNGAASNFNGQTPSSRTDSANDAAAQFEYTTVDGSAFKVLGTTGLDSCTGVVILSQYSAIVAHFSAGSLTMGGETALCTGFKAWLNYKCRAFVSPTIGLIFRAVRIVHRIGNRVRDLKTGELVTRWAFVPIDVRMDEFDQTGVWKDVQELKSMLMGILGIPDQCLRVFTECHPYNGANGPGEAVLMVDGRSSPAAFPKVYAKFYGGAAPL